MSYFLVFYITSKYNVIFFKASYTDSDPPSHALQVNDYLQ